MYIKKEYIRKKNDIMNDIGYNGNRRFSKNSSE